MKTKMKSLRGLLLTLTIIAAVTKWSGASYVDHGKKDVAVTQVNEFIPDDLPLDQNPNGQEYRETRAACDRRGKTCNRNMNACCAPWVCRCILWGTNCRCQRTGLF